MLRTNSGGMNDATPKSITVPKVAMREELSHIERLGNTQRRKDAKLQANEEPGNEELKTMKGKIHPVALKRR